MHFSCSVYNWPYKMYHALIKKPVFLSKEIKMSTIFVFSFNSSKVFFCRLYLWTMIVKVGFSCFHHTWWEERWLAAALPPRLPLSQMSLKVAFSSCHHTWLGRKMMISSVATTDAAQANEFKSRLFFLSPHVVGQEDDDQQCGHHRCRAPKWADRIKNLNKRKKKI